MSTADSERAFAELSMRLRLHVLKMTSRAGSSHIGTNFSMIEILAFLYTEFLRVAPADPEAV